jgi:DUF1680 family protein
MNPSNITLHGLLGDALAASRRGRLSHFVVDETSPAIRIFGPEHTYQNTEGDWYGEHAGKWLFAAARAAARTQDAALVARVKRVAHFLADMQQPDGYLGTYAPQRRFMVRQPPKPSPGTWDGAPSVRTWDIWTHSYLILGLLEVHRHFSEARLLNAARKIGDLCWHTLQGNGNGGGGIDITELGNHHGLSATVLMDPAAQLYLDTGERRYLDLALLVLAQADANPDLALLRKALNGADAAEIATGKAYQLQWNLVGLAKLHRATGREDLKRAVESLWSGIREHHLTLGGGPWGGVAHRSREVFNARGAFSPHGYVETCSTLSWIQLNRELLAITDEPVHAEEIERSAYNDLLGALAPNGEDWCYYVFPNGRRVHTTYWRCCKSSGAMALEELPGAAYRLSAPDTITIDLLGPGEASFTLPGAGRVRVVQQTAYPFDGAVQVDVEPEHAARFTLRLRVPSWADGASLQVNGADAESPAPGRYAVLDREWRAGDRIALHLPMSPRLHRRSNRNVQESRAPDGTPVRQEVLRQDYAAITRGPLVYATDLIDGFKTDETLRLPEGPIADWIEVDEGHTGDIADAERLAAGGPTIRMTLGYRAPLVFSPYYRAGGREHGAWRLTWLSLAPDRAPPFTEES